MTTPMAITMEKLNLNGERVCLNCGHIYQNDGAEPTDQHCACEKPKLIAGVCIACGKPVFQRPLCSCRNPILEDATLLRYKGISQLKAERAAKQKADAEESEGTE